MPNTANRPALQRELAAAMQHYQNAPSPRQRLALLVDISSATTALMLGDNHGEQYVVDLLNAIQSSDPVAAVALRDGMKDAHHVLA